MIVFGIVVLSLMLVMKCRIVRCLIVFENVDIRYVMLNRNIELSSSEWWLSWLDSGFDMSVLYVRLNSVVFNMGVRLGLVRFYLLSSDGVMKLIVVVLKLLSSMIMKYMRNMSYWKLLNGCLLMKVWILIMGVWFIVSFFVGWCGCVCVCVGFM